MTTTVSIRLPTLVTHLQSPTNSRQQNIGTSMSNTCTKHPNVFTQFHNHIYELSLETLELARPEKTGADQTSRDFETSEPKLAFDRNLQRLYRNLIALEKLARLSEGERAQSAQILFKYLPDDAETVVKLFTEVVDMSSTHSFMRSMFGNTGGLEQVWNFSDLSANNRGSSDFKKYCDSLPALSPSESILKESVADFLIGSQLDAVMSKDCSSPTSIGLTASEEARATRDFTAKNLRLARIMDDAKKSAKEKSFCRDLAPNDQQFKDGFAVAGTNLWKQFTDSKSKLFGNLQAMCLIYRSLQVIAVALTNKTSRDVLETKAPELVAALSRPRSAGQLINFVVAHSGDLNPERSQELLDRISRHMAAVAWGGAYSRTLEIALPVLAAGQLTIAAGNAPEQNGQELSEAIAAEVYAYLKSPVILTDHAFE
ncbi:hypothetical protein [Shewanella algae]|uniref:hypothetical protein n=1 Tax=Shewanella algae TaxID=38313 RepID=UPI001C6353C7|nr:hypothetical protein [Shewanella algae]